MTQTLDARDLIDAAPEEVGLSSARLQNVTRLVQGYVDDGKIPGAIAVVGRRGKVVHFETHGRMDDEAGKPMRPDTIFRIHSMTKPITSVALMTLYEEGRFQLDDPVSKFVPQFAGLRVYVDGPPEGYETRRPLRPMTIRDVLMHTSGLAGSDKTTPGRLFDETGLPGVRGDGALKDSWTLGDMIEKVSQLPLQFDPGTRWNYGISTDVVAYLAEVISGVPYDRFVRERILEPLGMVDTAYSVAPSEVDRFAACYRRGRPDEASYVLIDPPAESRFLTPKTYFAGAGGLTSTAADYIRFCKMLANGGELEGQRILGPRTLEFMTLNHLPGNCDLAAMGQTTFTETAMNGIGFGLGMAVLLDPAEAQVIGTPGEFYWGGAASTAFFVNPEEDLFMIFLTQLMPSGSYPFRRELRSTIYPALLD